jgi:hypothetical protein
MHYPQFAIQFRRVAMQRLSDMGLIVEIEDRKEAHIDKFSPSLYVPETGMR